ncbi:UbiA family prenyltransferase [Candidatus Undinarchaeota archaeon]
MVILSIILYIIELFSQFIIGILQGIIIILLTLIAQMFKTKRIKTYLQLSRLGNSILTALFVLLVCFMSGMTRYDLMFSAAAAATLITAAGNSINDYFDRHIDKINKPKRPIPSRKISAKYAFHYSWLLFIVGIIIAIFINVPTAAIAIINSFILYKYAESWKKRGFFGNLAVGYLAASVFIFAAAVSATLEGWLIGITIAVFAFLVTLGREIAKDMEDLLGDRFARAKTLPIVKGQAHAGKIASVFLGAAILFSWVPYILAVFSVYYLPLIALADILLLSSIYSLIEKPNKRTGKRVRKSLKKAMFIALIAFLIGSPKIYELVLHIL